ncbi:MAG: hypothetical protein ACP5D7_17425 [Limnospira sp.]
MTGNVRQWLDEIKRLREELGQLQRDRDTAIESADQWRERYNTEAQQRREDARRNRETIAQLQAELERLQEKFGLPKNELLTRVTAQREVEGLHTAEELRARVVDVTLERDRAREQLRQLTEALETEKAAHLETRNSLTTALGDTMDLLAKAQGAGKTGTHKRDSPESQPQSQLPPLPPN